ncbi:MAG: F0F1 ATP synthase subunit A [Epsilonproteobacteria bacterium]|nr:F0F1 ATP synthase subunit A [Campylobacterota bacterium]
MSMGIFDYERVQPFTRLGLTGPFWTIHLDIVLATWIAMAILLCIGLLGKTLAKKKNNPITAIYEQAVQFLIALCKDSFHAFEYNYFLFIATIFLFTFFCCLVGLIPLVEEATKDLNTTLALGLTSFLYVQYHKIRVHGIGGYLHEFIEPIFLLAPIHVVGELAKIASMSFRLFGNIIGGGIILGMVIEYSSKLKEYFLLFVIFTVVLQFVTRNIHLPKQFSWINSFANTCYNAMFILTWFQFILGIFEGLVQSFVLTMLTITYLAMGTAVHTEQKSTIAQETT